MSKLFTDPKVKAIISTAKGETTQVRGVVRAFAVHHPFTFGVIALVIGGLIGHWLF